MPRVGVIFACLAVCLAASSGYKIVIFVPTLSNSQTLLNYNLGELIASAGHEVTLFRPTYNPEVTKGKPIKTKELRMDLTISDAFKKIHDEMQGPLFEEAWISPSLLKDWMAMMKQACQEQMESEELMAMLSQQDLAIVHPYDFCPFGLIHAAKVPTRATTSDRMKLQHIWMSSTFLIETMASTVGVPNPTSFVPNLMSAMGDRMTYWERMKNTVGFGVMNTVMNKMLLDPETELFRDKFGPDFPHLHTIARHSPLVFINSEPFLDLPRPVLHKVIYIGGFGRSQNTAANLNQEYQSLMDSTDKGLVLVSFGSVANSSSMPLHWKHAFLKAFAHFPQYTFLWKYEQDDFPEAKEVKNLRLSKWVPQKDLFGHPKMAAFITHGGYNSFLEAMYAGIPCVPIPLFGDQFGTAIRGKRHGVSFPIVPKTEMSEERLVEALNAVLNDPSYMKNAKKMSSMLQKAPVKAEQLITGWVEFLAEQQTLPHLEPASLSLSFTEYFLLDVAAGLIAIPLLLLFILWRVLKLYYWWCCGTGKTKKD